MKETLINSRIILNHMVANKKININAKQLASDIYISDEEAVEVFYMLNEYGFIKFSVDGGWKDELTYCNVEITPKDVTFRRIFGMRLDGTRSWKFVLASITIQLAQ